MNAPLHVSEVLSPALPVKPRTLDDLLRELERKESLENPDVTVPMNNLRLTSLGTLSMPEFNVRDSFEFTPWAKAQLASIIGVRWDRWFRHKNALEQANEVNGRLGISVQRLRVRTTRTVPEGSQAQGTVTALLSESYTPLPDTAVLRLLATALREIETDLTVAYAAVTDRTTSYMIGVGTPFRPGDDREVGAIQGGVSVRNSGVGAAAFGIFAGLLRLICKNGMTAPVDGALLLRRAHRAFDIERLRETLAARLRDLPGKLSLAGQVLTDSRRRAVTNPGEVFLAILRAARLPVKLAVQIAEAYDVSVRATAS